MTGLENFDYFMILMPTRPTPEIPSTVKTKLDAFLKGHNFLMDAIIIFNIRIGKKA